MLIALAWALWIVTGIALSKSLAVRDLQKHVKHLQSELDRYTALSVDAGCSYVSLNSDGRKHAGDNSLATQTTRRGHGLEEGRVCIHVKDLPEAIKSRWILTATGKDTKSR